MSNIADIVNVNITIESPVADTASYSNLLLVVDPPATPEDSNAPYLTITEPKDLTDVGYLTTEPAYVAASLAFSQNPRPAVIYIAERQEDSGNTEAIATTLNRVNDGRWYGISFALSSTPSSTDLSGAAAWAEANEKLFGFTWTSSTIPVTISSYARTFAMYGGSTASTTAQPYANVAWMAKCFGYEPGSETWAEKTLNGVEASVLSATDVSTFRAANANFYQVYANRALTLDGKTGTGEWIDVIRFRDWLVNQIRVGMVSLFAVNRKIAFTDPGITAVQGVIDSILKSGQTVGGIAPDQFDADGNVTPGYTVHVPTAAEVSDTDKAARRLTGVTFKATLSGAIHYAEINGALVY